jgi:hypothetical protein
MNWIVAGLIGGVVAWVVDFVMWGKVFTTGMEAWATMEQARERMAGMMVKSAVLAMGYGVLFAFLYQRLKGSLWAPPGLLGGAELGCVLWLPIGFAAVGSAMWFDKLRRYLTAQFWAWFVRMNVVGAVTGLLLK